MRKFLCAIAIGASAQLTYGKAPVIQHPTCELYIRHVLDDNKTVFDTGEIVGLLREYGYTPILTAFGKDEATAPGEIGIIVNMKFTRSLRIYHVKTEAKIFKRRADKEIAHIGGAEHSMHALQNPIQHISDSFIPVLRKLPRCNIIKHGEETLP